MGSQFYLRVNGIGVTHLKVRRKLVSGEPVGDHEVVIEDPVLGSFAIDDSHDTPPGFPHFIIELKGPLDAPWKSVSVPELLAYIGVTAPKPTTNTN